MQCFFGGAGCSYMSSISGALFITMFIVSSLGEVSLMRHAEGATLLSIVTVTFN